MSIIARQLVARAHEGLLRRPTFRCLRELERSQWLAPDDLTAMQTRKLSDLLRHAAENVPYYRVLFRTLGLDPAGDDPRRVLAAMPLLTKADIRARLPQLLWDDAPGRPHRHNTGGSTGEPLTFYLDRRRQAYDQAARIRTHRWFGVDLGARELLLWGSPIEHSHTDRLRTLRDRAFNQRLLDAFAMSPARMDDYLDAIARFRPACLFGYPSSIALLAEHAKRRGWSPGRPMIRAVFVTGEVCYEHHRRVIGEVFAAPVADCYGSREGGFIAHQCPLGGMHITAENVIVETLCDGRTAQDGEDGEIVVTHLDAYAMPFIRYRTGDVGRLGAGRCACGRGLPLMDMVAGRTTDFLYLPDGTIKHALSIIYPLRELPGVRQFRVTQRADYATTVAVVPQESARPLTGEIVSQAVRKVLGRDVKIDVEFVREIPPTDSGKHRYVVSHVQTSKRRNVETSKQEGAFGWHGAAPDGWHGSAYPQTRGERVEGPSSVVAQPRGDAHG